MIKRMRIVQIVAMLAVLALAMPLLADSILKTVSLRQPAKLGSKELKPGDYQMFFDGAKVTMKKGRKVVAEAKGEWAEAKEKATGDSFVVENGQITEIRIQGRTRMIKIL